MTSPILVTGGTGTLSGHVLPLLRASGHDVRVLTRYARPATDGVEHVTGDLPEGEGVEAAVDGVETVLHLAGGPKGDDEATRTLVRAASRAGVRHLLYISVIGADRVPLAWMRTKLESERAVADSGIPWTTLRAAQFHDLALTMVEKMAKLPVFPVASGSSRWTRGRSARLAELTLGDPSGLVADMAGPDVHDLAAPGPPLPPPARPAPPDAAGADSREGGAGVPGGGEPDAGGGGGREADLGGVPSGEAGPEGV